MSKKWYFIGEFAKALGMKRQSIYPHIKSGLIKTVPELPYHAIPARIAERWIAKARRLALRKINPSYHLFPRQKKSS